MFTYQEIKNIVGNIRYLNWEVRLRKDGDRPYLQVFGNGPAPDDINKIEQWSGRKWFVSPHMCKNEIIRTAYKAVECAVLHEMDEQFKYKNVAIFTPHMNYDIIVEHANSKSIVDSRDDGMQGI